MKLKYEVEIHDVYLTGREITADNTDPHCAASPHCMWRDAPLQVFPEQPIKTENKNIKLNCCSCVEPHNVDKKHLNTK